LVHTNLSQPIPETNLTLDIEVSAKDFFLRGAKSLDDVTMATCSAQGFASLRGSPFHFDGDLDFSLFLRSASAFGLRPVVLVEIGTSTTSIGSPAANIFEVVVVVHI